MGITHSAFLFFKKRFVLRGHIFNGNGLGEADFEGEHPHDEDAEDQHEELPDPERGQTKRCPGGRGIGVGKKSVANRGKWPEPNEEPHNGEDPRRCHPFLLVFGEARDSLDKSVVFLAFFAFSVVF